MSPSDADASLPEIPLAGTPDLSEIAEACRAVVTNPDRDRVVGALLKGAIALSGWDLAAQIDHSGEGGEAEAILEGGGETRFAAKGLGGQVRLPRSLIGKGLDAWPPQGLTAPFTWEGRVWLVFAISDPRSRETPTSALVLSGSETTARWDSGRDFALRLLASQAAAALDNARRNAHYRQAEAELAQSEEKFRAHYFNTR